MIIKNIKINHDVSGFHEALSIPEEIRTLCQERIFFTTFANAINCCENYEDTDEAPIELRTVTGNLKNCLSLIDDKEQLQYEFTLLIYMEMRKIAMECVGEWWFLNSPKTSKEDLKRYKMKDSLTGLLGHIRTMIQGEENEELKLPEEISKILEDSKEEENHYDGKSGKLSRKSLIKRIDLVKKANFNFAKYLTLVENMITATANQKATDDLLKGLSADNE